jgi:MFS superfamily sulfate permease-like transporter
MKDTLITQVADTLTKKPEYGIISSMLSISMSATDVLQLIGVILGLFIAIITAILKVMELRDRIRERKGLEPKRKTTRRKKTSDDDE